MKLAGKQTGGQVFVDYTFDAGKVAGAITHNRNTASADCNHNEAALDKCINGIAFDDLFRHWRWYYTTPTTPGILDHCPAFLCHFHMGILFLIKGTNGFARIVHSRVIAIYEHLGDDSH